MIRNGLLLAFFAIALAALPLVGVIGLYENARFDHGEIWTAVGRVTGKREWQRRNESYGVEYEFTAENGRHYAGKDGGLSPDRWSGVKVGDPVTIEYDSAAPSRNRVAGASTSWEESAPPFWIGLGLAFIGAVAWEMRPRKAGSSGRTSRPRRQRAYGRQRPRGRY